MAHDISAEAVPEHVVIVGAGHAGGRVAQQLQALGFPGRITLIGDERHAPYERPALSKDWLTSETEPWTDEPVAAVTEPAAPSGAPASSLALAPAAFWDRPSLRDARIERMYDRAIALDTAQRLLTLASGTKIGFDRLVVATGGQPRDSGIVGADLPGVHVLRTIDDSLALRRALRKSLGLVIIGAGVIGMEVASAALDLGVPVTVLEAGDRVLSRCLPPVMADWLLREHRARGVRVESGVAVEAIVTTANAQQKPYDADAPLRYAVRCKRTGTGAETFDVAADTVLIAIGVDCSPAFLADTDLAGRHGVNVDEWCRSPRAPWLYAVGDVAHVLGNAVEGSASGGVRQETWRNAENQALAVAEALVGRPHPYRETQWMWTDQLGYNIQVVGQPDPSDEVVLRGEPGAGPALAFSLRDGKVVAGVLVNAGRERRFLEKLVGNGISVDPASLADPKVTLRELTS
ncbi:p-cumate 2,3-dioxygenase system, ferredoxin--NAD(+) reductase component [Paraburkholderia domus]|jgi:NAD(P)H-nitrite reductase|uniref:p-cumate 2,3-dioxygenase system, ferredoxin--NAD(+) reductase component n=1 Tax=Paraburkholderia domus TaxID=2793075 RepID=A0A9N8MQ23_9BURK|nr:FAD-dependent oxidoreductase [Paraburkholderia domus]MBK5061604.1 FAD-dependent oxidoreductase [Burkholderia sp. R-70199]MBK5088321.1 FAD-dependent oxidoreductase [Burkholderia sp. R-69927]MBK5165414.1 FAD-dependent oxidoreductase [Burkholderia sp. R-70211]CAE6784206.1 p-cumate 2,3-dioxygenase system, ferredoxin--NAD(+) reductase component [Paraburkholderia domus]CAE6878452.1 p-cumate 2,3-dioxygenase system, ferredoxin--NAD(+) reductase component [Paraburkholderia domus]